MSIKSECSKELILALKGDGKGSL